MSPDGDQRHRGGIIAAWSAYGLWGLFPLYFDALKPAGAWEILAHRILWSLAFCLLVLVARRDLGWVRTLAAQRRRLLAIAVAAILIAVNWVVYVSAVITGHTSEAALGYFLNPLVTVALGVVVLGERLRPLQWLAVAIGTIAAAFLTVTAGRPPLIALTLACSFALYGLVKKRLGASMPALHTLTAETLLLAPAAAVMLALLAVAGTTTFTVDAPLHPGLLIAAGAITAVPLLLFSEAARRIPLVTIGLIQFVTPVMQLLVGVLALHEHVRVERWIGFAIVWLALLVLSVDSLRSARQARLTAASAY